MVAGLARRVDHPSLSSAVHAAGALRDATVGNHFAGSVRDVAGSKVGSLARIEAAGLSSAAGQPLGSMVLFSSTAALMGSAGQVSYSGGVLAYIAGHDIHHALRFMSSYDVARQYPSGPAFGRQRGAGRLGGAASGGGCQRDQRAVGGVGRWRHGGGRRAVTPHALGHGGAGAGGGLARAGRHYVRPTGTGRTWSRHDSESIPLVRAVKLNSTQVLAVASLPPHSVPVSGRGIHHIMYQ